jgi:hypothetical protein
VTSLTRIEVNPIESDSRRLWQTITHLAEELRQIDGWCLVGGLMVQLFAYENEQASRPTTDIDLLADARRQPSVTEVLARKLEALGASTPSPSGLRQELGYGFTLDGQLIEILAPDGLARAPRTLGRLQTIQVPGGSQALERTEEVELVVADGPSARIRRPTLLAAVLLKARAVPVHQHPEDQLDDVIQLLASIDDPRALAQGLRGQQKKWLGALSTQLAFDDPRMLDRFGVNHLARARAAFQILIS